MRGRGRGRGQLARAPRRGCPGDQRAAPPPRRPSAAECWRSANWSPRAARTRDDRVARLPEALPRARTPAAGAPECPGAPQVRGPSRHLPAADTPPSAPSGFGAAPGVRVTARPDPRIPSFRREQPARLSFAELPNIPASRCAPGALVLPQVPVSRRHSALPSRSPASERRASPLPLRACDARSSSSPGCSRPLLRSKVVRTSLQIPLLRPPSLPPSRPPWGALSALSGPHTPADSAGSLSVQQRPERRCSQLWPI